MQWASYYGVGLSGLDIAYHNNELALSFIHDINNSLLSNYYADYVTADAYQQTISRQIITNFNATTGQRTVLI